MLDKSEIEQLDRAWKIIMIIWGTLVFTLVVYLVVCKLVEDQLKPMSTGLPLETMTIALFGVSIVMFIITHYVRKAMMKVSGRGSAPKVVLNPSVQIQSPAAGKYLTAIIVAMALSESIGIYGLALFFLSKDSMTLYLFISMSAIAMFYYRPRKEELLQVALEMQQQGSGRRV